MDLVADMLLEHLPMSAGAGLEAARVQPAFRRRFSRPAVGYAAGGAVPARHLRRFNLDRGINRFWDYPRSLSAIRGDFDLFHVVDHSYSQLVHALPAERTVVTCHDLHAFQCLFSGSSASRRSAPFRWMMRYVLRGLEKAARVVVDTAAVGEELIARKITSRDRLTVAPLGVHPAYGSVADTESDAEASALLAVTDAPVDLLHVGSTSRRKRLDLVLRIFAGVRKERPDVRLIRVGGALTGEQAGLARELGVEAGILSLPFLDQRVLAAVYRRAALTILPSEEEGFGLPVLEAMACGTPVLASYLPVLREVGGEAAAYCDVGDVNEWVAAIVDLLRERERDAAGWSARRRRGIENAAGYTWPEYARKMAHVYRDLLAS